MTEEEKQKVLKDSLAILEAQCFALGIKPDEIPARFVQLAFRMFVEGVSYKKTQDELSRAN
jgi:hypothetical protein